MTVELKTFCGALFPKDKALKNGHLDKLAIAVKSKNKTIAEAIITGKLAEFLPANTEDYFKAKVWEDRVGLPRPSVGEFTTDFFETIATWNAEKGEPEPLEVPHVEDGDNGNEDLPGEVVHVVKMLDTHSRAASLALFGPVPELTAVQYSLLIDLKNDDEQSFAGEITEAISRETKILALEPEQQIDLLAHIRETCKETAQWTDIVRVARKWLEAPADKRPQSEKPLKTSSGATLGGGETDRPFPHNLLTLEYEISLGLHAREREFNIYIVPLEIELMANSIMNRLENEEFLAWREKLVNTPGILDFSRAIIIAMVKTADPELWKDTGALRNFINRSLNETNHASPDQLVVDIACGNSSSPLPQNRTDSDVKTGQVSKNKVAPPAEHQPENAAAQPVPADLSKSDGSTTDTEPVAPEKGWVQDALGEREQAIKSAVEFALGGNTNIFNAEEAAELVSGTGHDTESLSLWIMIDIAALEDSRNPQLFSDEDIHHLALDALEEWSDNPETRFDYLTKSVELWEQNDELPSAVILDEPEIKAKTRTKPEVTAADTATVTPATALTYRQQLTIAALQGLCANPACFGAYDDLPGMAMQLAASIIHQQEDPQ